LTHTGRGLFSVNGAMGLLKKWAYYGESMLFNGPIINPRFKVYSWFVLSMGSFFTSYPR